MRKKIDNNIDRSATSRESFLIRFLRKIPGFSLCSVIYKALEEKDFSFPELVNDYEKYHREVLISPLCHLRIKLFSDWIKPGSVVLDAGCGEGLVAEYLSRNKKCKMSGIDISVEAASKCTSKGFNCVVRDIDVGLGLSCNEKYDYILFVEVLEHLRYPHKILVEACKHVNEGVIVTLPNSGYIRWRIHMLRGYFPRQSFTHLHFWSIKDFELFVKTLNLVPLKSKTDLDLNGIKKSMANTFKNLLAYQQCWLIAPLTHACIRNTQR